MKRSKLETLLSHDPLFQDPDLASRIDWGKVADRCELLIPRSLAHLRLSWVHLLSPRVNNRAWTIDEKRSLKNIVTVMQLPIDWDQVALQMNTQRTPFACFSRFQIHLHPDHRLKGWNERDNAMMAKLLFNTSYEEEAVEINWKEVKLHFPGRSKTQIYSHWKYHLSQPDKSKFNDCEDALIDTAFRLGFEFSKMAHFLFGQRRSTVQVRERCNKLMRHGSLDLSKWQPDEDNFIRKHFGDHHSKLRNADNGQLFIGRSSAQISMRYHFLMLKDGIKRMRYPRGLIRKRQPKLCERIESLLKKYYPEFNLSARPHDEFPAAFQELCEWFEKQKLEQGHRHGRPKKQPLTKEEEFKELVGPLFFINLHQARKTTYPGDGREHGLILAALYRLMKCDFSQLKLDFKTQDNVDIEEILTHDGIQITDQLSLVTMKKIVDEFQQRQADQRPSPLLSIPPLGNENIDDFPTRDGVQLGDEFSENKTEDQFPQDQVNLTESVLPPTINTLVGLRGLQLHRKLLDAIANDSLALLFSDTFEDSDEDRTVSDNDSNDEDSEAAPITPADIADAELLSRMLKLFFWPAVMSQTTMPESMLQNSFVGGVGSVKRDGPSSAPAKPKRKKKN